MAAPERNIALTKSRTLALLDALDAAPDASPPFDAITLALPPGAGLDEAAASGPAEEAWLAEMRDLAGGDIDGSETGAVLFWSESLKLALLPPLPLAGAGRWRGVETGALKRLLRSEPFIGVLLLRLGGYSVGVFQGERLVDAKTGQRYVKGRHSAGGTSQRRFVRVREKQIHQLYVKVCQVVRDKWEPRERSLERVFLGGERHTLNGFLKECPLARRLGPITSARLLPAGEPKRRELERMPREVWKTRVFPYRLPEGFPFQGLE